MLAIELSAVRLSWSMKSGELQRLLMEVAAAVVVADQRIIVVEELFPSMQSSARLIYKRIGQNYNFDNIYK